MISKLRFIEGNLVDTPDFDDPPVRLDADFILLTGTINRILESLKKLLGAMRR